MLEVLILGLFCVDEILLLTSEVKLCFPLGLWKDLSRTWWMLKISFRVTVTKSLQAGISALQIQVQHG